MACCNASTLSAERRRRHFSRTSLNTRSTALSQEPLVGVGCALQSNSRIGSIPDDGVASETCARSRLRAHPSRRTTTLFAAKHVHDLASEHIHRGEQSSRSVALIIVGLGRTMVPAAQVKPGCVRLNAWI